MADSIEYEILEDGTISIKTSKVSAANHVSADQFIRELARLQGGQHTSKRRLDVAAHLTMHEHTHDGHTHTH